MENTKIETTPEVKTQEALIKEHLRDVPNPTERFAYVPGTRKPGSEITISGTLYVVSGSGNLLRMSKKSSKKRNHRQLVELKKESLNPNLKEKLAIKETKRVATMLKEEDRKRKIESSRKEPEPLRIRVNNPIIRTPEELEKISKELESENLELIRERHLKVKLKKKNRRKMQNESRLTNRKVIK